MRGRRVRWGRVVGWAVIAYTLVALAWALAVGREPGTLTVTEALPRTPTHAPCQTFGRWVADDGATVLERVEYDGTCLDVGMVRPAYRYTALGPWPVPGGAGTVHEPGAPVGAVLVAVAVVAAAGTALWFESGGGLGETGDARAASGRTVRP